MLRTMRANGCSIKFISKRVVASELSSWHSGRKIV